MGNVHVCNNGISSIHGKELPEHISIPSRIRKTSHWNERSTYLQNWCPNKMKSMEEIQLIGKIIHWSICLWLVMNKSSVFSAQRSTSFQILYCVLVRYTRPSLSKHTLHGKTDWRGSKVLRNAETLDWIDGEPMEFEWNNLPGLNTLQLSQEVKSFTVEMKWNTREFYRKQFSSCRCSTTSHGDQETMKVECESNAQLVSPCCKRDLEQDNGHFSVLVLRKSGILSVKIIHKVNGTE